MTIVILFWIPGKKFIPFFNRFNKKFNLFFKQLFLLIIIQSKFSVKMFLKNGQHLKLTRRTSSMMGRRRLPSSSIIFCWINRRQLHSLPSFISLSLSLSTFLKNILSQTTTAAWFSLFLHRNYIFLVFFFLPIIIVFSLLFLFLIIIIEKIIGSEDDGWRKINKFVVVIFRKLMWRRISVTCLPRISWKLILLGYLRILRQSRFANYWLYKSFCLKVTSSLSFYHFNSRIQSYWWPQK